MTQTRLKRLLILNIPYVLIGLYATKLAEAWRLAEGTEISEKLLHLMDGFLAAFPLDVHVVEDLVLHRPLVHALGQLEDAVGDRRLAVVDVRNDREVADVGSVKSIHADHLT